MGDSAAGRGVRAELLATLVRGYTGLSYWPGRGISCKIGPLAALGGLSTATGWLPRHVSAQSGPSPR